MSRAAQLRQEAVRLQVELDRVNNELEVAKGDEMITCSHCNSRTAVKHLTLLRHHNYVEPYSCSGGDYWTHDYDVVVCHKCMNVNRADDYAPELNKFVQEHFAQFKEVIELYMRRPPGLVYQRGEYLKELIELGRKDGR